jgi:hypothetical protein
VDIPDVVMWKVTRRFDGMTPMERLVGGEAGSVESPWCDVLVTIGG